MSHEQEAFRMRLINLYATFNTQHQAARAAGVPVATLRQYLSGEEEPTFAAMAGLCRAAGRSLDWLSDGSSAASARETCARIETLAAELSELLAGRRS